VHVRWKQCVRTVLHSVEVYVQYFVLCYLYCSAIPIAKDIAATRRAVYFVDVTSRRVRATIVAVEKQ
jgi:hypothetical protein